MNSGILWSKTNPKLLATGPPGSGTFPTFVSVSLIDLVAIFVLIIIVIGAAWRYLIWKRSSPPDFLKSARGQIGLSGLVSIFFSELVTRVLFQKDVINDDRVRRFTHLSMFWGFIGLSVTTSLDYIFNRPGNYIPLFGSNLSTIRLLGNISGVIMMIGATIAIVRLVAIPKFRRSRSFADVWFTVLLFLTGVSGFVAEYYGEVAYAANPTASPAAAFSLSFSASPSIVVPYGFHLVLIGLLFVSAPVSAFMHVLQVPSMRYLNSVGEKLAGKGGKNALRKYKESAMLDEIQGAYEKPPKPVETEGKKSTESDKNES